MMVYNKPEMEIVQFAVEDVITQSPTTGENETPIIPGA